MSRIPLLELPPPENDSEDENNSEYQSPSESHTPAEAHRFSALMEARALGDEFGRPLTAYERDKMSGRRRKTGAAKLKRLTPKHFTMIQLHLKGWSGGAIAAHVGVSQAWLSTFLGDPLVQDILQQSSQDTAQEITALIGVATDVVRQALIGDTSHSTKMAAVDRLEKLHKMTGSKEATKTAEDLVQELLSRGATVNIIKGENVQVNNGSTNLESDQ